jgi:hypothetical protein
MLPVKKKKREESAAAHWFFKVYSPYSRYGKETVKQGLFFIRRVVKLQF